MAVISISSWELGRDLAFRCLDYNIDVIGRRPSVVGMTPWESLGEDPDEPKWRDLCITMMRQHKFRGFKRYMQMPTGTFCMISNGVPIFQHGTGRWAGVRGRSAAIPWKVLVVPVQELSGKTAHLAIQGFQANLRRDN